jgi:hypothetical protein
MDRVNVAGGRGGSAFLDGQPGQLRGEGGGKSGTIVEARALERRQVSSHRFVSSVANAVAENGL